MSKNSKEETSQKPEAQKTEAEKIWAEIKNKKIEMFSLPSQIVSQYCKPATVEPSKLYVIASATSVLPALEIALGATFTVERMERFLVIARKK
jgi:hypothetical protein